MALGEAIHPYVANVTAEIVSDTAMVKELLEQQVSSSVRWQQSVENMLQAGIDTFVEIGPGKTLAGFMKKILKEYAGKIVVYKVNVDDAQALSRSYGIRSIPAFLLIPTEGEPQMAVGSMPKTEFKKRIEAALLK